MPFSDQQGKDVALAWYREIAPKTVVDVGAGSGTYAWLMRRDLHDDHWTAVEAWEPYVADYGLEDRYDSVIAYDARHLDAGYLRADLVIFGDVLEHMTRAEAQALLTKAQSVAANIIVSIPVLHLDQEAVNGNPFERHVDHWGYEDMREQLMPGVVKTWCGDVLGYFWWSAEAARKHAAWQVGAEVARKFIEERGESPPAQWEPDQPGDSLQAHTLN